MADILHFSPRQPGSRRPVAFLDAEVVLFPGVRIERLDPAPASLPGDPVPGDDLRAADVG